MQKIDIWELCNRSATPTPTYMHTLTQDATDDDSALSSATVDAGNTLKLDFDLGTTKKSGGNPTFEAS